MNPAEANSTKGFEFNIRSRLPWFCIFVFAFCFQTLLCAQDAASITGTVTDPTGAAIPNAQVSIQSQEHGITRTTVTNGDGNYLISAVSPGSYQLSIAAPGFNTYEAKGIILRVAQKARADASLQVATESTEVTVVGANVATVETQTNEVSGTEWR